MSVTSLTDLDSLTFLNSGSRVSEIVGGANTLTLNGVSSNFVEILRLADPTTDNSAVNRKYVDSTSWKTSVRVATTTNGSLATAYANGQSVDGVVIATGDLILLKDQTIQVDNGIYTVNASGAPSRHSSMKAGSNASGNNVAVKFGTINAGRIFTCNNAVTSDVVGVNNLTFTNQNKNWIMTGSNAGIATDLSLLQLSAGQVLIGGNLRLNNLTSILLGPSTLTYDGTNTLFTSTLGNLRLVNTNTTGLTHCKLGTNTNATAFQVLNNSDTSLLSVYGDGITNINNIVMSPSQIGITGYTNLMTLANSNLTVVGDIQINNDTKIKIGTSFSLTYSGNAILSNTGVTSFIVNLLGTDTTATAFTVRGNGGTDRFRVYGDGTGYITGNFVTQNGLSVTGAVLSTAVGITNTAGQVLVSGGNVRLNNNIELDLGGTTIGRIYSDGTNSIISATSGNINNIIQNSAASLYNITTSGGSTRFSIAGNTGIATFTNNVLANSGIAVTGAVLSTAVGITNTAGEVLVSGGNVRLANNISLALGTSSALSLLHNGTNTVVTSTTGNLVTNNTSVTGQTQWTLGTSTTATRYSFKNSSLNDIFNMLGDRNSEFYGNVRLKTDGTTMSVGASDQLSVTHDGTNGYIQNDTGTMTMVNADTTSSIVLKTGTSTSDTSVEVQNSGGVIGLEVSGALQTRHGGPMFMNVVPRIVTGNTHLWTAAEFLSVFVRRTNTSNTTDTLPTATNVVNAINNCTVNTAFYLSVISGGARSITLSVNTGVTFSGVNTIASNGGAQYLIVITNVITPAYTIYTVSKSANIA